MRRAGFLQGIAILLVLSGGFMGWRWLMQVTLESVEIRDTLNATDIEIRDLVALDTGIVLYRLDTVVIEDRIRRHPWVESANVSRLPTGTMIVDVSEREPVVQVIEAGGRPDFYMDRFGFPMARTDSSIYDVPLFFGYSKAYHPLKRTEDPVVRAFLEALAEAPGESRRIISEVSLRSGEVWLRLVPAGNHGATPVRMGDTEFGERLVRLSAFWEQAMITRQDKVFEMIDLRFKSQIVAREKPR